MTNSVRIRIGAAADTVEFSGSETRIFDRAAMKYGCSGANRADIDSNFAEAIVEHMGIKDRRRDRRANKHKDRRRGEF
ncbi:hypothetical protein [Nostoc phage NMeng1]|nr:hypothetical protein [Nostoc phage NMeng1]